mmetsp:Transcript_5144/g.12838  ORF Transcript_5144/g.12838 Transcript_5144/m.12838 type:complete len:308 (+) Transcript_5144:956-1879(+)
MALATTAVLRIPSCSTDRSPCASDWMSLRRFDRCCSLAFISCRARTCALRSCSSFSRCCLSARRSMSTLTRSPLAISLAWLASWDMRMSSVKSWSLAFSVRSSEPSWLSKPMRSSRSRFTICSYVLRIDCASLYFISALSKRFSSILMCRVIGVSCSVGRTASRSRSLMPSMRSSSSVVFLTASCLMSSYRLRSSLLSCCSLKSSSLPCSVSPALGLSMTACWFVSCARSSLLSRLHAATVSLFCFIVHCDVSKYALRSPSKSAYFFCRSASSSSGVIPPLPPRVSRQQYQLRVKLSALRARSATAA